MLRLCLHLFDRLSDGMEGRSLGHKLARTTSFTEIPLHQRIILEQQTYDNHRNNGLYRRVSCEQIVDNSSKFG